MISDSKSSSNIRKSDLSSFGRLSIRMKERISRYGDEDILIDFSSRHTAYLFSVWFVFVAVFICGFIVHFETDNSVTASSILWTFSGVLLFFAVIYSYLYYKCAKAKTKEELYELLDIESAEDFKYVENVAQYLECEDEIDFGVLAKLIEELDKDETAGLFDDYFEEIMEFIPEAETEIYGLFTNIRRSLTGMLKNADEVSTEAKIAEERAKLEKYTAMMKQVEEQLAHLGKQ